MVATRFWEYNSLKKEKSEVWSAPRSMAEKKSKKRLKFEYFPVTFFRRRMKQKIKLSNASFKKYFSAIDDEMCSMGPDQLVLSPVHFLSLLVSLCRLDESSIVPATVREALSPGSLPWNKNRCILWQSLVVSNPECKDNCCLY